MTTGDLPYDFSDWEEIVLSDGSVSSDWSVVNEGSSSSSGSDKDDIKSIQEHDDDDRNSIEEDEEPISGRLKKIFMDSRCGHYPSLTYDEFIEQNILLHLPAKSLLRLKSLSRHWKNRISTPFFTHLHSTSSRSLDGFFFHSRSSAPAFASFHVTGSLPDPTLSFLPDSPVRIKSSNHGLLCCVNLNLDYVVCNPVTSSWALLPTSLDTHGPNTAVAIVMKEPHAFNFASDYYIVCAYEILGGVFGFEVFSSETWEWRRSKEIVAAESVVPGSGVSVRGWAYWRTTMQTVVGYNPEIDLLTELMPPFGDKLEEVHWEIGEMGRKLCCVGVRNGWKGKAVVLEGGGKWREVERFWVERDGTEQNAVPLRTQGDYEVAVWDTSLQSVMARNVERGSVRDRMLINGPGYCADFMPFVSSLIPVKRQKTSASENLPNSELAIKESVVAVEKGVDSLCVTD